LADYQASYAQQKATQRFARCRRKPRITGALYQFVIEKLEASWSPEQISGRLARERKVSVSHETIYRFTRKNRVYRRYLRFAGKRGAGRYKQRKRRAQWVKSIHQRPKAAQNRSRFGHWERDGMYAANKKQLLVCVERKSRFTKIGCMLQTNSAFVGQLTEELLKKTRRKVLSITNDNGSEFRKAMKWDVPVYYCDPFKPQQRGTVENTIGVIRRFVTRKTDLEELGEQGIAQIENMLNHRPRKVLDYRTPYEVFYEKKVALVSGI
jgi:IS30 family transposase